MKGPFSFRPSERLKKHHQFQRVYKEGRPVKSENFKLIYLPTELSYNRVGFSLEAKKIRLPTRRVRVKRLLREIFRQNKSILKTGFDIVIIAGAGAQKLDFKRTKDEVFYLYKKARLLNETYSNTDNKFLS